MTINWGVFLCLCSVVAWQVRRAATKCLQAFGDVFRETAKMLYTPETSLTEAIKNVDRVVHITMDTWPQLGYFCDSVRFCRGDGGGVSAKRGLPGRSVAPGLRAGGSGVRLRRKLAGLSFPKCNLSVAPGLICYEVCWEWVWKKVYGWYTHHNRF